MNKWFFQIEQMGKEKCDTENDRKFQPLLLTKNNNAEIYFYSQIFNILIYDDLLDVQKYYYRISV